MFLVATRVQETAANYAPREVIQDLWSAGYTIVRRQSDPYHVDPKSIPPGMVYEWRTRTTFGDEPTKDGWEFVLASRHDGIYAPVGYQDVITIGASALMERPKEMSDKVHAAHEAKAHQNVTDWIARQGAAGFSGGVRVWTGDPDVPSGNSRMVGEPEQARKVIEATPQFGRRPVPISEIAASPILAVPSVPARVPRHPALRWLFNLISTEQ